MKPRNPFAGPTAPARPWHPALMATALAAAATLTACGGGGGGAASSSTKVATFIDSPVAGLTFQSPSRSGLTDRNGNFPYTPGETVTFSIGNMVLGSVTVTGNKVTPLQIVPNAASARDPRVTRILRTLQTLDSDGDLNNGIQITAWAREVASLKTRIRLDDAKTTDDEVKQRLLALQLPLVRASVSVGSLWRLGFEQIVIDQPVLDVRRTAQGRIEVAGLDLSGPGEADSAGADWFFSQDEFVIQGGTVRWTDDLRGQPPLALSALDFVLRNTARRHEFRLDATPPADWGQRLSLRGQLREPLLNLRRDRAGQTPWHNWSGELFADFTRVDVARLRSHVDLSPWGVEVRAGQGALRACGAVHHYHHLARVLRDGHGMNEVHYTGGKGQRPQHPAIKDFDSNASSSETTG